MAVEFDACPFCGGALERGYLKLSCIRPSALRWKSDEKYPIEGAPKLFKNTFLGRRALSFTLLANGAFGGMDCEPPGGYCEKCMRVFAAFSVGDQVADR